MCTLNRHQMDNGFVHTYARVRGCVHMANAFQYKDSLNRADMNVPNLVVGRTESTPHILVVKHLNLEGEVLFQVLNDHHKEGQLDAQRCVWLRTCTQN